MLRGIGAWVVGALSLAACQNKPVLTGEGFSLQDASGRSDLIAYTDEAKTLFVIDSANGGEPLEVLSNVDKASFRGDFLIAFEGVDLLNGLAATTTVFRSTSLIDGDLTPAFSNNQIALDSVRDSDDGTHLFYEAHGFTQSAFLDGQEVVSGAQALRGRFSSTGNFLVVSADLGGVGASLRAFPLDGGAALDLSSQCGAEGCSTRFQVAPDGNGVVVGANEIEDFADLTLIPFDGSAPTQLVLQGGDNGFTFLDDDATLVFLQPDLIDSKLGALQSLPVLGGAPSPLGPIGVLDISSTANDSLVYVSAFNGALSTLHFINADGSGDLTLGASAKDEGFTPGNTFFLFLDQCIVNLNEDKAIGTLRAFDTANASIIELGASVSKVEAVNAKLVVFLTESGELHLGELDSGDVKRLARGVDSFNLLGDGVVFSIPSGKNAGLFFREEL